jgi:hypothetical protein
MWSGASEDYALSIFRTRNSTPVQDRTFAASYAQCDVDSGWVIQPFSFICNVSCADSRIVMSEGRSMAKVLADGLRYFL